ncbi:hypothetical protein GOP47_0026484 [Adiantum capillus-veneris]|nr:hypothetical protein GOP47_0026484 [Adiantum capillus-veneris]
MVLSDTIEASRQAVKAAGYQNEADFVCTVASSVQLDEPTDLPPLATAFKTIVLFGGVDDWMRLKFVVEPVEGEMAEGVDILMVDLSELARDDRTRLLHALPCIPPFSTLCLLRLHSTLESAQENLTQSQFHRLFSSLVDNGNLSYLYFSGISSNESTCPRILVLDNLRPNGILHDVHLGVMHLAGDAAIKDQLRKNQENAARVALLKSQGMDPVRPSTIRLYLCGLPFSGKTSLSRSLAKCNKGSISRWPLASHISKIKLSDRTRGIEVTVLEQEQANFNIILFMIACFQTSMIEPFPLYFCMFGIPLSYMQMVNLKQMPEAKRADLGLLDMRLWLHTAFMTLQKQFKEYICFDEEGFFQVDARYRQNVSRLASHLFKCTKDILSKAPDDFKVCVHARELFENLLHTKDIPPLITKDRFNMITQKRLGIDSQEMSKKAGYNFMNQGGIQSRRISKGFRKYHRETSNGLALGLPKRLHSQGF